MYALIDLKMLTNGIFLIPFSINRQIFIYLKNDNIRNRSLITHNKQNGILEKI